MPRVIRTPQAKIDLLEIWIYIASRHGASRADKVVAKLKKACSRLGSFPMIGPARPELQPGLRSLPESGYLIFYRVEPASVQIVRVIHGSRHLPDQFS